MNRTRHVLHETIVCHDACMDARDLHTEDLTALQAPCAPHDGPPCVGRLCFSCSSVACRAAPRRSRPRAWGRARASSS
eukprot:scaffold26918_cov63-Phaeocystis_antarctica.AAC.5